jgi:hypothetical protein
VIVLLGIALVALVALVLLLRKPDLPKGDRRRGDQWGFAAAVVLIVGGLAYDSTLVGGVRWIQIVIVVLVFGLTVGHVATAARRNLPRPVLAFIPMLLAFYMFVLSGLQAVDSDFFGRLAPVVLWACLGVLLASGAIPVESLQRTIVVVTCVISVAMPLMPDAFAPCSTFKCGLFGELLVGPFASENYLAQLAALSMIIGAFSFRGALRISLMTLSTLLLVATESRTSQIAVAAGLLIGWVIKTVTVNTGRSMSPRTVVAAAWMAAITCAGIGCYLIYHLTDGDFSNRANIWARGVGVLGNDWMTGLGGEAWSVYQANGALPPLFPHSEYLMMLFWGGVIGVVGYTAMMAVTVCRAARTPALLPLAAAVVGFLLTLGMTEAFWNPAAVDGHSFFILFALAIAYHRAPDPAPGVASRAISDGPEGTAVEPVRMVRTHAGRHARDLLEEGQ